MAQEASHCSRTRLTCTAAPRSTYIHCGSTPDALAQRVLEFPSTAFAAGQHPPEDDTVTGFPCDSKGSAASAGPAVIVAAASARAIAPARIRLLIPSSIW
ncbi:hypothetical protein GCM10017567_80290 [Amycolatopsis bullii]|uniref:Uncharacterized protein n=1 Tax=Amycolatopsis bullii TaxID=941987 RepID=A0ABQ3KZ61_9PSEU|nr:hypothetical protein GCM10017567_80290 [Amycolatopsis bullii]